MTLLFGSRLISLEDLMNDLDKWLDDRPVTRLGLSISRWFVVLQDLLKRLEMKFVHPASARLLSSPVSTRPRISVQSSMFSYIQSSLHGG